MNKRVVITLIAFVILIASIIGIRNMLIQDCETPLISFKPANPVAGTAVRFICENANENIEWELSNGVTYSGKTFNHTFTTPGKFFVKAIVSDVCENSQEVNITSPVTKIKFTTKIVKPDIKGPTIVNTNTLITFSDKTLGGTYWKWQVLETGEDFEGQKFQTLFDDAGIYTVIVTVRGNNIEGKDTLTVNAKNVSVIKPRIEKPKIIQTPQEAIDQPSAGPDKLISEPVKPPSLEKQIVDLGNKLCDSQQAKRDWKDLVKNMKLCKNEKVFPLNPNSPIKVEVNDGDAIKLSQFTNKLEACELTLTSVDAIKTGEGGCIKKIKITASYNDKRK